MVGKNKKPNRAEPEYVDDVFDAVKDGGDPWDSEETPVETAEDEDDSAGKDAVVDVPSLKKPDRTARSGGLPSLPGSGLKRKAANPAASSVGRKPDPPAFEKPSHEEDTVPSSLNPSEDGDRRLNTHGKGSARARKNTRGRRMQRPFPHGRSGSPDFKSARARTASGTGRQPASAAERAPSPPPVGSGKPAPPAETETEKRTRSGRGEKAIETTIPEWIQLEKLLEEHEDLPEGTIVLGVDEDGKPLVISLDDPSTGPLLVTGEDAGANRKHLRMILASGERINPPELLQIDVITPVKEGFESQRSNLRTICGSTEPCVYERLDEYLETIEGRLKNDRQLPFRILVLDSIEELVEQLAEDSLRFLRWMMRRGPQVGIRVFASIDAARLSDFDRKTFRAFDLLLCGKITAEQTARTYTGISPDILKRLSRGTEGCFKLDDRLIRYSIPEFSG